MAVSSDVLASTLAHIKEEAMDGLFKETPLLDAYEQFKMREELEGGSRLICPAIVENHSSGTDLVNGDESINLSFSNFLAEPTFVWSHRVLPVGLSLKDKTENQGDSAQVKLVEARLKRAMSQMKTELNTRLVTGGSTGQAFREVVSLNGMATAGQNAGVFEGVVFGSQTNSVGGVAKAGYPLAWQHQYVDIADDFSANGYMKLVELIRKCNKHRPVGKAPSILLMSSGGFINLQNDAKSSQYITKDGVGSIGFESLVLMGVPVVYESDLWVGTNKEEVTGLLINLEGIKLHNLKDAWFDLSDWQDLMGAGFAGEGCKLYTAAALGVSHLSSSGIAVDGDTL